MPPPLKPQLEPLAEVIAAYGLATKKSLGQHFLLDGNLLNKVVRATGDLSGAHVIEVGPGPGGLTRAILESNALHVTAIEKDRRCLEALAPLKEMYGERFTLLEADALEVDITTLGSAPRNVIANLPYNVGTALVVQWLQQIAAQGRKALTGFTVMLQKEVAQRMVEGPGSKAYGRLSVLTHLLCDADIMFDVPPGAFLPPPNVMSSVVAARVLDTPRENVPLADLEKVVAAAFGQRRKMLRQSLKTLKVNAQELCDAAGIDATLRPEQCDLKMFADLARSYLSLCERSSESQP